jgi:hypothetical protein
MSKQARAHGRLRRKRTRRSSRNGLGFIDFVDKMSSFFIDPTTLDDEARYARGESDPYYYNILVGGANAGGKGILGLSDLPFGVLSKGTNRKLFRHNQNKQIRQEIDNALKKGLHPRVVGHSWGGSTVANIAKDYPDIPFYAMDPVSWTHRLDKTPKNLTIYYPNKNSGSGSTSFATKLAPIFGGRWSENIKGEGNIRYYNGDHVEGVSGAVTGINNENMKRTKRIDLAQSSITPKFSDKLSVGYISTN